MQFRQERAEVVVSQSVEANPHIPNLKHFVPLLSFSAVHMAIGVGVIERASNLELSSIPTSC